MFGRINQKSAVETVVGEIREAVLSRRLAAKARLPAEKMLAAEFGVSRPTLREALRMLVAEGLIEVRKGDGIYVGDLSSASAIHPGLLHFL